MKFRYRILKCLITISITTSLFGCSLGDSEITYKYGEVAKGSIATTVTSTGSLEPLTSVDVGTQVSGTITSVYTDYNDVVKKGQLLAVLDTFLLKLSVNEALANLEKSKASLDAAESEYNRKKLLYDDTLIAESDFILVKTAYRSTKAQYKLSKISYTKAKRNLGYAYIKSPINGVIIGKEVEEGQTVASSLSAPTLFNVAQDLKDIRILAEVDESDIGTIKEGMDVTFTVQAYPDREYKGVVTQIRLQAEDISNVINYTAVVSANNEDLSLLPGMTTTVDFIVNITENILTVPSKALKYSPSEDVMQSVMERHREARMKKQGANEQGEKKMGPPPGAKRGKARGQNMNMLWYVNDNGEIDGIPVKTGDTNGSKTEVSSRNEKLVEGLKIIVSSTTKSGSSSKSKTKTSLNSQQRGGGMGGGPPPRF